MELKKYCLNLLVSSVEKLNEKYVLLKLTSPEKLPFMMPGQFVQVKVEKSPSTFLRRPISINFFDEEKNEMWLLVAAAGEGTKSLFQLCAGESINCVFPLGKSFTVPRNVSEKVLLVGGGVGIAPLLYFGKFLADMGCKPNFLLGARTENDLLELSYFEKYGKVYLTTEDGSRGEKGFVTNHSILQTQHFDRIAVCGPKPMMVAVARYARQLDIECEVSLENLMACGIGACLCCVEQTTEGNLCVCKEGPVLNIKKLLWHL